MTKFADVTLEGSNQTIVIVVAAIALAALFVAAILVRQVLSADQGTARMQEIAEAIQEGASAFLSRQFRTLAIFAVIVFFVLFRQGVEEERKRKANEKARKAAEEALKKE